MWGGDDNRVKNYNVVKSLDYADRYMFIARPLPCHNTAVLHYILDGMYEDEDYEVALGFTNISDITNADLSVNLDCYVHYFKEGDNYNPIGNTRFEWNINARENILEKKFGRFKTSKKTKRIVVTIVIKSSPIYAVLGVDYIKINSKRELTPKTQTPVLTGGYNECVTQTVQNLNFSDYFQVATGTPRGTLRFYEDANLTKSVTTFASAPVGIKTYYYTYQEDGKEESESGTLTVTVKGNETLTVVSDPTDATITCNNPQVTLTVEGTPETTLLKWTGPKSEETNVFTTSLKGEYKVEGIGSNGCPAYGAITVKENKDAPSIISLTSTDSEGNLTTVLNCAVGKLTITPKVSSENVLYAWSGPNNFSKNTKVIEVTAIGTYTLVVTNPTTGCSSDPAEITITEDNERPKVKLLAKGSTEFTCEREVIELEADTKESEVEVVTYQWAHPWFDNKTSYVEEAGEYTVTVVGANGCKASSSVTLTENKVKPVISVKSYNLEGKETTVLTCRYNYLFLETTLHNEEELGEGDVVYTWLNLETDGGADERIVEVSKPIEYQAVVKGGNGCKATENIKLSIDTIRPKLKISSTINTITCKNTEAELSVTSDIEEVEYLWMKLYVDVPNDGISGDVISEESTAKVTEGGKYEVYVDVIETGCVGMGKIEIAQSTDEPNVPEIDVNKLNLCPSNSKVELESFLLAVNDSVSYTFYDKDGNELPYDSFVFSNPDSRTTLVVNATDKSNGCVSGNAQFDVVVDGLVDFDLVLSRTDALVVGDDIVATVVPTGVEADTYTWQLNGENVSAEGLEYSSKLYLDSDISATGTSRCDSKTKTASVKVIWPTAFTPHNQNGKNDDFAKGLPIIVFNRHYTKIFEGNDGWNGSINGSLNDSNEIAVPGVYYYSVQLPNGQVKKGTIEIVKVD